MSWEKAEEFWEVKMSNEFDPIERAGDNLTNSLQSKSVKISYRIFGSVCKSFLDLERAFAAEYTSLFEKRQEVIERLKEIGNKEQDRVEREAIVQRVAECHLRLAASRARQRAQHVCELCKSDSAFKEYARCLFTKNNNEDVFKPDTSTQNASENEVSLSFLKINFFFLSVQLNVTNRLALINDFTLMENYIDKYNGQ